MKYRTIMTVALALTVLTFLGCQKEEPVGPNPNQGAEGPTLAKTSNQLTPDGLQLKSTGGPFYARISRGGILHTDDWAAIAFYRDPACVPAGFNLLDFFDPNAFGCSSFVSGIEVWKNGPQTDPAPIQSKLQAIAPMPIWFVSWTELQAAIADNVLTVGELLALPSLQQGTATFFTETLHPIQPGRQSMINLESSGVLPDGRGFRFHATVTNEVVRDVDIRFTP